MVTIFSSCTHLLDPPILYHVSPDKVPITGGIEVFVVGAVFFNSTELYCKFGNKEVPAKFVDKTLVTCVTPAHDEAEVDFFGGLF